jgi:hypothetical protein
MRARVEKSSFQIHHMRAAEKTTAQAAKVALNCRPMICLKMFPTTPHRKLIMYTYIDTKPRPKPTKFLAVPVGDVMPVISADMEYMQVPYLTRT